MSNDVYIVSGASAKGEILARNLSKLQTRSLASPEGHRELKKRDGGRGGEGGGRELKNAAVVKLNENLTERINLTNRLNA